MPMTQANEILNRLKEGGHRLTRVRRALVEAICESNTPLSAAELGQLLENRNVGANKTTIYREVDFLVAQRVAVAIDLMDGRKRYEILSGNGHHHLVCTQCKDIKCVEIESDVAELEKKITSNHNFKVQNQVLEFFGICEVCSGERNI
jgi:Fur family transcriptional regulator, ferric uptake regulator